VVQLLVAPPVDKYTGLARVQGPFLHPNVLAKFLVIVLLALLGTALAHRGAHRWVPALAAIPVVALIGATFTRIAWIAAVLGVGYLVARTHRWLLPFLVGGVLGVSAIPAVSDRLGNMWEAAPVAGVPGNSLAWRLDYWGQLLPLWRHSPLNGVGLEVIPTLNGQGLEAHSVWVQSLVEMGLVGLGGLLAVTVGFVITARRRRTRFAVTASEAAAGRVAGAIGIALLTMSFTENILSETTTLWYSAAVMACGLPTLGDQSWRWIRSRSPDLSQSLAVPSPSSRSNQGSAR
jgi:putative inorganic carbon (hco3(-)) transporter